MLPLLPLIPFSCCSRNRNMGNAQSAGRKRNRSARPKSSSKSPEQKKARKVRNDDEKDGDVECVTPAATASTSSSGRHAGIKWKPAHGSAKLTQSLSPQSANATSSKSSRRRDRRETKEQEVEPPLKPATSGPRCRKGDSDEMFAVEAVVKKWVGPSDRSQKDVFYLIHFAGQKRPALKNTDESLWQHPTQMLDCNELIEELEQKSGTVSKVRRPVYYYTNESESDEPADQRLVFESSEINGRSLRKRQENGVAAANDDKSSSRKLQKDRRSNAVIGFERGLEPLAIIGSTHYRTQILYAVKWKDCDTVDFVVSTLCHKKIPDLVIDYLVSKLENVPAIESSELALNA